MLVSHDRALLRSVCDEFWLVTRGGVEPFDGDLDDYQRYLLEEGKRVRESLKDAGKQGKSPIGPVPRALPAKAKPLQQALAKLDKTLADLHSEKTGLETRLAHAASAKDISESAKQLQRVTTELAKLEEEWISLSENIEALRYATSAS